MDLLRNADVLGGKVAVGSTVTVQGWVRTRRDSKAGVSFIHLSDGSCFSPLQVVAPGELDEYDEVVKRITTGCATGEVVESQGKGQTVEILASSIELIGDVDDPDTYPMQAKRHSLEFLREVAHLRPRTNIIGAVARVRHTVAQAIHRFFHEQGFYWIHTPIITANDCEGAGEMFRVSTLDAVNPPRTDSGEVDWSKDFFGRQTHLTVSGQLNVETYCMALSRVYTFGPTFRAENSHTRRHLSEFWMIEPEIAFADLSDVMDLAEDFIRSVTAEVHANCSEDMDFFNQWIDKGVVDRVAETVAKPFVRMPYTEAMAICSKSGQDFEFPT
ncbi:MAG TPA: asparagine--tRNA ligase, partial [Gemmatimonadetes bacterium]|nr:asparagine--tRNA ligase [Gemmatimonadota bacterium]